MKWFLTGLGSPDHPSKTEGGDVKSVIEVKISPEREGGFDRLANRISKFEEVEACHLMSGAYDLLVIVKGKNLHSVATFVSERLATIEGVLSTATHFLFVPTRSMDICFPKMETIQKSLLSVPNR